ncbi:phage terminase large subunit-like protein [Paenibacillus sp. SORGH_AS306]|uniref:terminase large subunit n=1 Tax=unclassified Paenibacillus TaxID=185978 RepID=UPI0027857050|nr:MULTISPECIES: terminase TerL endonuclease subunit [unclassified Paenibacillus]MDQ1233340.1 phage terminase large subunit-like protein [Paenibacillus sp. SORGH_AS_0306]MDR6110381.1 phage terminase large subunit-like protein [Paenibacillus sp. SORGH_AS_0338]
MSTLRKKYPLVHNPIIDYWDRIESGKEIVGDKVRRVYKQLAKDVYDVDSVYEYSPSKANHAIEFIENFCKHSKGKWGGKSIDLELWQQAFIAATFGFVHKIDGTRKYREVFLVVARKNGKSTLASGIGLYLQVADGEPGSEVYAVATKKDQAKLVWMEAKRMVKKSPTLLKRIKPLVSELVSDWNDSSFKPLGSDSDTLDGLNVHGALLDEIHAWKDKNLYDVIVDGTSSREQPLLVMITTAGTVREAVYDQKYSESEMILNGYGDSDGYHDDRFLPIVYELDDRLEWTNSVNWRKANPGLGTIKKEDQLRTKVNKAIANSMLVKNLLTKDFNVRETSAESWLSFEDINNMETFDMEELRDCYAVGGVDLSSTTDLSCATLLIMKPSTGKIYGIQMYFLPEELVELRKTEDKIPYDIWSDRGLLRLCPGNKVNYSDVTLWFLEMVNKYEIRPLWVGYDPWGSQYWIQEMKDHGFELSIVRQGAQTLSQPMKEMGADLKAKLINYNNNPITKWCLTNTAVKHDDNDNIRPIKGKNKRQRIDGAVSLLIAYTVFFNNMNDYKAMMSER